MTYLMDLAARLEAGLPAPETPISRLTAALPAMTGKNREFAESLIAQSRTRALSDKQLYWVNKLATDAAAPRLPAPTVEVGNTLGILDWFNGIKAKKPSVVLVLSRAPGGDVTEEIRISRYGAGSKYAGQLKVASHTHFEDGFYGPQGVWYGSVSTLGTYTGARKHEAKVPAIAAKLAAFAASPATVAAEDGKAMGRCCFCYLPLSQDGSLAVGYGQKCAKNHGLPWTAKVAA